MKALILLTLLLATDGGWVTTTMKLDWAPLAPDYFESALEQATTVCGYGGPATIDPDDAGHWWLRCSTVVSCGNGAPPRVEHRDAGEWLRHDVIVCDARRDGGR